MSVFSLSAKVELSGMAVVAECEEDARHIAQEMIEQFGFMECQCEGITTDIDSIREVPEEEFL